MAQRGNINKVGSQVVLSCEPGYEPEGQTIVKCSESGNWTLDGLNCTKVSIQIKHLSVLGFANIFYFAHSE